MRDGIVIGVLLDHFTAKLRSSADHRPHRPSGPSIFFTAVIYPVVKVHRPKAVRRRGAMAPRRPSGPLVGELLLERTDQGIRLGSRTRVDGSRTMPANRRWSRAWDPGVSGWTRAIRLLLGRDLDQRMASAEEGGGDEETRTPDPLLAKEMLFQLSYVPVLMRDCAKWWALLDSNQGPRPYQGRALTS